MNARIIESTAERLEIRSEPTSTDRFSALAGIVFFTAIGFAVALNPQVSNQPLNACLVSLGLIGLSVWASLMSFNSVAYTFDRPARTITVERRPFGSGPVTYPVGHIQGVKAIDVMAWPNRRKKVFLFLKSGKRFELEIPPDSDLLATITPFLDQAPSPANRA